MTSLKDFFWFCAGANHSLLRRCPTETSKFTGIGAAVFFTGLLAAFSGGYAFGPSYNKNQYLSFGLYQETDFISYFPKDFAVLVGISPKLLKEILKGEKRITPYIATKLFEHTLSY